MVVSYSRIWIHGSCSSMLCLRRFGYCPLHAASRPVDLRGLGLCPEVYKAIQERRCYKLVTMMYMVDRTASVHARVSQSAELLSLRHRWRCRGAGPGFRPPQGRRAWSPGQQPSQTPCPCGWSSTCPTATRTFLHWLDASPRVWVASRLLGLLLKKFCLNYHNMDT